MDRSSIWATVRLQSEIAPVFPTLGTSCSFSHRLQETQPQFWNLPSNFLTTRNSHFTPLGTDFRPTTPHVHESHTYQEGAQMAQLLPWGLP
jgi:hypothetical protein